MIGVSANGRAIFVVSLASCLCSGVCDLAKAAFDRLAASPVSGSEPWPLKVGAGPVDMRLERLFGI